MLRPVFLPANDEIAKVNAACAEHRMIAEGNGCICRSSQENADYNGLFFFSVRLELS